MAAIHIRRVTKLLRIARGLSRAPFGQREYCIKRGYRSRERNEHYDDSKGRDEWQREVYLYAARIMKEQGLRSVIDVGCGSGYKLVNYLSDFETIGVDVPPAFDWLRKTYPDKRWLHWDEFRQARQSADLVLSSDVIEHFPDPDELVEAIRSVDFRYVILSTPDRDLVHGRWEYGPPENDAHCREWNMPEFRDYIGRHFSIIDHTITNRTQGTQLIMCTR
jgi:SAM-dependent methyltransferase